MFLREMFEARDDDYHDHDSDHFDALHQTGFFGKQGAGCIFVAKSTGRILLNHRSHAVLEPGDWGVWGGAINGGETPEQGARREVQEEAGYHGHYDLVPLYVFSSGTFRYSNFMAVVDDEFTPMLDWESQGYRWCVAGAWPTPMHFGLKALLSDSASMQKIMRVVQGAVENVEGQA